MPALDGRADVDFVVGPVGDGVDEVLPEPGHRRWTWPTRFRVPLTALAAAVVLAAVLTLVHENPSRPTAAAPPTPSAVRHPAVRHPADEATNAAREQLVPAGPTYRLRVRDGVVIGPVPITPSSAPVAPLGLHRADLRSGALAHSVCGGAALCITSSSLPAGTSFALQVAYPRIRHVQAVSVLSGHGALRYRAVLGRAGARTIEIVVRPTRAGDIAQVGRRQVHGRSIVYALAVRDGRTVVAQAYVPAGSSGNRGTLQQLAADPSLTTAA